MGWADDSALEYYSGRARRDSLFHSLTANGREGDSQCTGLPVPLTMALEYYNTTWFVSPPGRERTKSHICDIDCQIVDNCPIYKQIFIFEFDSLEMP